MKFENTEVFNFEGAIRGMRNPLASHEKSDSYWDFTEITANIFGEDLLRYEKFFVIGENDLQLAKKLIHAGTEHRKFLRQILVSVDIIAPLYLWKELDTYKIGTTSNSYSTMHKLTANPITWDSFEFDDFMPKDNEDGSSLVLRIWEDLIFDLERLRKIYIKTNDKRYWRELVRLLPSSWLQIRTVTLNYENLLSMYHQREHHKLSEWRTFCSWVETLPYTQTLFDIG